MLFKVLLFLTLANVYCGRRIVCYWFDDNPIENIDPHLCTHIHCAFAILDKDSLHFRFEKCSFKQIRIYSNEQAQFQFL
jgi:hypothetical protein